jgi:hypothetical protein
MGAEDELGAPSSLYLSSPRHLTPDSFFLHLLDGDLSLDRIRGTFVHFHRTFFSSTTFSSPKLSPERKYSKWKGISYAVLIFCALAILQLVRAESLSLSSFPCS